MKSWKLVLPVLHICSHQIFSRFVNLEFVSGTMANPTITEP